MARLFFQVVIGKRDLLQILHDKTTIRKQVIEDVLEAFIDAMKENVLEDGHQIRIRDFGTFKQKNTSARKGRNPRTGEELDIAGSTSLSFSAASMMKVKDQ